MSFRNFRKRVKRALRQEVSSDSDGSDYAGELLPYNPDLDTQLQERKRRYEETGRQRAESPTRMQTAHADQRRILKARRRINKAQEAQAAQERESIRREAVEYTHNFEINEMIENINRALGTNVDMVDPRIRFVIGQIVNVHGLTLHSLRLMRRSRILLSAIGDIASRAGRGLVDAGQVVYSAGQAAISFASRGASVVTSRLPSLGDALSYLSSRFSSQPGASGQRARSPHSFLQEQGPPNLGFQEVPFSAQAPTLDEQQRRRLEMDRNLQLQSSSASASAFGRQSLPFQSQEPPPPPPPASAPAVEEDDCSICMTPLRDNVVLTRCGHKFHSACVTPWLNSHDTCPLCRNENPTPLVPAPAERQRQGGGGSRKTRLKSKSKSKSKTRRLRKSRKPRKSCKSRKPRSSSRRK
jgi:hypothetical protein